MPLSIPFGDDVLGWQFPMFAPIGASDAPPGWVRALEAVGRDLQFLRYGRDVDLSPLHWTLKIDEDYNVGIGWIAAGKIKGGFGAFETGGALPWDAPAAEAMVWIADLTQTELAGYQSIQWPSRGWQLLLPRLIDGVAMWVDPHGDVPVAAIGELGATA
ncbi:hypothetical protein [Antrihabitans stalagmiti]|nr:hypothetical protein [Antrihabitans stalagmiti]